MLQFTSPELMIPLEILGIHFLESKKLHQTLRQKIKFVSLVWKGGHTNSQGGSKTQCRSPASKPSARFTESVIIQNIVNFIIPLPISYHILSMYFYQNLNLWCTSFIYGWYLYKTQLVKAVLLLLFTKTLQQSTLCEQSFSAVICMKIKLWMKFSSVYFILIMNHAIQGHKTVVGRRERHSSLWNMYFQ